MIAALALLGLAGCQQRAPRPPCPAGQTCLELGNGAEPTSLDPAKIDGTWETNIVGELIQGLIDRDAQNRPIPGIATSWSVSADGLTWTFHLRDARWSDGEPVTAADFVYGIRRVMDPKTASFSAFLNYPIRNAQAVNGGKLPTSALGVEAPDPHTLVIRLEHPWPMLLFYASGRTLQPIPRRAVERWGDAWTLPGHYVGDGPYSLVAWRLGDRVTIRKNPSYWDADRVCADRIDFFPTSDAISAERRVGAGELDANQGVQSNRIAYLRASRMAPYLRVAPEGSITYLPFNVKDTPPLRDVRVRQALSMAIDREFITRKLLRGGQVAAYSFVPRSADYAGGPRVAWADWSYPRRQARARALLAEAGYGPDRRLKLSVTHRNSPDPILFLPSIQADWRAIGVDVELIQNDTQVAYQAYEMGDFQIADAGWIAESGMTFLDLARSDTGGQNFGQYKNPAYDAALDAANREPDLAVRQAWMRRAEQILLDDQPIAPLYFGSSRNLVNPRVSGWGDNAGDNHPSHWLCLAGRHARPGR